MKLIKKLIPTKSVMPLFRIVGSVQGQAKFENIRMLKQVGCERKSMFDLAGCGKKFSEFIREYCECTLQIEKQGTTDNDAETPVAVCVVKNDLMRMKLFMSYYREHGVKQFAILDDHSDDGTLEYLLEQDDVTLFSTEKGYTTVRRQVWLTKIVEIMGFDRWYLILDSDELFDYRNSEKMSLKEYVHSLRQKGMTRAKAILLDMFAPDSLYSEKIHNENDIVSVCNMFYPDYWLEKSLYDKTIRGGARGALFGSNKKDSPFVSKYPLIYADEKDIFLNSHYYYPFVRNKPDHPFTVLRHYKFMPGDRKKYEERIRKENFYGNGKDYIAYSVIEKNSDYAEIAKKMTVYESFSSTKCISIMEEV